MARASPLYARYEDIQREACPINFGFYHCGAFEGCCAEDPCAFLDFVDPCGAAVASAEYQGGSGNDDGDDDGDDDDDGDGDGGDEEMTSTTRHTSTQQPSSTKHTETTTTTNNSATSSVTGIRHTSSPASFLLTTGLVETSSPAVNTTTFPTGVGISTSATSESTTETTRPAPSPASDESESNSGTAPPLSDMTIAGASVGGAIGGIALLLLVFWLLRRRRLSKRMSSLRGESPTRPPKNEKSTADRRHSLTGTALGTGDVFGGTCLPPFSGQAQSQSLNRRNNYIYSDQPLPTRQDEGWPLCAGSGHSVHQPFSTSSPPQSNPQSGNYVELDSTDTQLRPAGPSALPPPPPPPPPGARSPKRRPSPWIHPPQLTPGFPGTQMAIQSRGGSRGTGVVGQGYHHAASPANAPMEASPRATLNATDDERMNNLYANSWARGL
ncbi:hypothetical protein F4859DRAFT_523474 [Xylaria cf. heliscus]|nr:hypothetical protein F4859DRAFT_523474 [Xylaria cf. heliscus]